jgi:hypothetical protein
MSTNSPGTGTNASVSESHSKVEDTGTLPSKFIETLQKAANNVFPTSPAIYIEILVLLLYCEDSDRAFEAESQSLKACFEDDFHFSTDSFEIPIFNCAF